MSRVRVPQHIQEIARKVVELTMQAQYSEQKLIEETEAIAAKRAKLESMIEELQVEEAELNRECAEWVSRKRS